VAGHEYARPHIGASITRANSGNGALPTRGPKNVENRNSAVSDRARPLHTMFQPITIGAVIRAYDEASNVIEKVSS
jgi:hypothetical protein